MPSRDDVSDRQAKPLGLRIQGAALTHVNDGERFCYGMLRIDSPAEPGGAIRAGSAQIAVRRCGGLPERPGGLLVVPDELRLVGDADALVELVEVGVARVGGVRGAPERERLLHLLDVDGLRRPALEIGELRLEAGDRGIALGELALEVRCTQLVMPKHADFTRRFGET